MAKTTETKTPKYKIRAGDTVILIAGKDRGERGKVVSVDPKKGRVLIEGLNLATKHRKGQRTGAGSQPGQKVSKAMPVHISNVMLVDPRTGNPARVGRKIVDGKLVRYSKDSGEILQSG